MAWKTAENLADRTYGKLYVISRSAKISKAGLVYWYCACECGIFRIVAGGDLKRGHTTSCGCASIRKGQDRSGTKSPTYTHGGYAKENARYGHYVYHAKTRGLSFELNLTFYKTLVYGACAYCGAAKCGGVDRVDNEKGYLPENCVGCCGVCNRMKNTHSKEFFIQHIRKILNN